MIYDQRVLVLEDEESIRSLIKRVLSRMNILCDLCSDGQSGLEMIALLQGEGKSYPVILTDLIMPRMNGIEFINEVERKVQEGEILPPHIYVISGYHEKIRKIEENRLVRKVYAKPSGLIMLAGEVSISLKNILNQTQPPAY